MIKSKKLKRNMVTIVGIIFAGSSFAMTLPQSVMAAPIKNLSSTEMSQRHVDPSLHESLRDILTGSKDKHKKALANQVNLNPDQFEINSHNLHLTHHPIYFVIQDGEPNHYEKGVEYIGYTELENPNNKELTMTSSAFSKSVSNTVSSSTTHGFKVGAKASAKFGIPLVGETSIELNAEYNFSKQDSNSKTETVTYTIPSQNIPVPAHGKAKVTASLKMIETEGKVKLATEYIGDYIATIQPKDRPKFTTSIPLGTWVKKIQEAYPKQHPELVPGQDTSSIKGLRTMYLDGQGTYKATYGSKVNIKVELFDKNGNPVKEYTFEATPKIKKNE